MQQRSVPAVCPACAQRVLSCAKRVLTVHLCKSNLTNAVRAVADFHRLQTREKAQKANSGIWILKWWIVDFGA